jgi:phosphoribosylanthranilate isomerase
MKNYIAISGITTTEEAVQTLNAFKDAGYTRGSDYRPAIATYVKSKSLAGKKIKGKRHPKVKSLPYIFKAVNRKLGTILKYNTNNMEHLASQVDQLMGMFQGNRLCRTLQIDKPWPDICQVHRIRKKFPFLKIILTANRHVCELPPREIAKRFRRYQDVADCILIDPSGDLFHGSNLDTSVAICSEIRQSCPEMKFGFAGGLSPENVGPYLAALIHGLGTRDFSLDTHGAGLRTPLSGRLGNDILNLDKVGGFLNRASVLLKAPKGNRFKNPARTGKRSPFYRHPDQGQIHGRIGR